MRFRGNAQCQTGCVFVLLHAGKAIYGPVVTVCPEGTDVPLLVFALAKESKSRG